MTWAKFSDDTPDDALIAQCSDAAFRLWFDAHCHCAAKLTDGMITQRDIAWILNGRPVSIADELVALGLWATNSQGWQIVGYTDVQSSRAEILTGRENARQRQHRFRNHKAGDHSDCVASFCKTVRDQGVSAVTRDATENVGRDTTPSKPSLAEPTPREGRAREVKAGTVTTPLPGGQGSARGSLKGKSKSATVKQKPARPTSATEKVFAVIRKAEGRDVSVKEVMDITGLSKATVYRAFSELDKAGKTAPIKSIDPRPVEPDLPVEPVKPAVRSWPAQCFQIDMGSHTPRIGPSGELLGGGVRTVAARAVPGLPAEWVLGIFDRLASLPALAGATVDRDRLKLAVSVDSDAAYPLAAELRQVLDSQRPPAEPVLTVAQ